MSPSHSELVNLPWDADFFGFPVARLRLQSAAQADIGPLLAHAQAQGTRLIYLVADPADGGANRTAAAHGARLVDEKVTYLMALAGEGEAPLPALDGAIHAAVAPSAQLERLAWQSGEYSRFRLDPGFETDAYQKLYSLWLRNSLSGQLARVVFAYGPPGQPELGLLTLGEKDGRADIGLLAVDEAARGRRVGQQLVAAAQAQARAWGHSHLQVVTQLGNVPACRFYEKCGFTQEKVENIYHIWLQ